jgi:hypothetical protein
VGAELAELGVAARYESLAGEVGVRELEQIPLVEESELQCSAVDERPDLTAGRWPGRS